MSIRSREESMCNMFLCALQDEAVTVKKQLKSEISNTPERDGQKVPPGDQ